MPGGFKVPVEVYFSWPLPNYTNPVTQPKYVLLLACIIAPISITLLCLRLWVRLRIRRDAGPDDWLIMSAYVPLMGLTVILPLMTERYYSNRHIWDIESKYWPLLRMFLLSIYSLFPLTSGLIKISVLLFYRRLSTGTVQPAFRWTLRVSNTFIALYTVLFTLKPLWACQPINAFWNQINLDYYFNSNYHWKCIDEGLDVIANSVISTVQDLLAAVLPSIICWKLQIPLRQKLALYGIFALSYLTVAIGALRAYMAHQIYYDTYDTTWPSSYIYVLILLELHLGCMCANAPSLKALYQQYHTRGQHSISKPSQPQCRFSAYSSQSNNKTCSFAKFWRCLGSRIGFKPTDMRLRHITTVGTVSSHLPQDASVSSTHKEPDGAFERTASLDSWYHFDMEIGVLPSYPGRLDIHQGDMPTIPPRMA